MGPAGPNGSIGAKGQKVCVYLLKVVCSSNQVSVSDSPQGMEGDIGIDGEQGVNGDPGDLGEPVSFADIQCTCTISVYIIASSIPYTCTHTCTCACSLPHVVYVCMYIYPSLCYQSICLHTHTGHQWY